MNEEYCWNAIGRNIQGESHRRNNNVPCQDALLCKVIDKSIIVAVADGHGSSNCPYSDEGAKMAVESAIEILENIYTDYTNTCNLSLIKQTSEELLKKKLARLWRERVREAYEKRMMAEELSTFSENFYIKYGSTLLAALVTPDFILYVQIGDGDIITVTENADVSYGIPKDENLIGVETTSLCSKDAWKDIRTNLQKINTYEKSPVLIQLSSDGYYNSFASDESFCNCAVQYLDLIRKHGADKIEESLEPWLYDISKNGSGDDVTLVFAYNTRIIEKA